MSRRRHPDARIEEALRYAERHGWRVELLGPRAHGWGKMYCPHNDPECRCGEYCITIIWGTPKVRRESRQTDQAGHRRLPAGAGGARGLRW